MAGNQIATSVTILNSLLGYQGISLTNIDSTAEPEIAAGSKIEIASAFFTFASNEAINGTSWSAISTGDTAYIALTPAGTAGSQTVSAAWTSTAPEWSTTKQGWYQTAGSSVRYIGKCEKTGTSAYSRKSILRPEHGELRGKFLNSYLYETSGVTMNTIFDAISTAIQTTGETIMVTGALSVITSVTSYIWTASHATRTDATTISIYTIGGTWNATTGNPGNPAAATLSITDGSATQYDWCSLAW